VRLKLLISLATSSVPTHFPNHCDTLHDLFFVTDCDKISMPMFSTHDLIYLSFNVNTELTENHIVYGDFKNIDYAS